jgi:hypothetical protein
VDLISLLIPSSKPFWLSLKSQISNLTNATWYFLRRPHYNRGVGWFLGLWRW